MAAEARENLLIAANSVLEKTTEDSMVISEKGTTQKEAHATTKSTHTKLGPTKANKARLQASCVAYQSRPRASYIERSNVYLEFYRAVRGQLNR